MIARTHQAGALAAALTIYKMTGINGLNWATLITASAATMIGGLLPDIDQASNRLWVLVPGGNATGRILRKIFLSHRTLSHSILGIYITYKIAGSVIFQIFNPEIVDRNIVFSALMIGFISHIILDALTEEGVPILFPLKWNTGFPPIKRWRIKTGRWFENLIIFPSIVLYTFAALFY